LPDLVKTLDPAKPPKSYLPFGEKGLGTGEPAKGLTATFSPSSSTSFELRSGRYVNTDSNAGAEDQFVADTVLVLRVRVGDAGYLDPAGNPVPETKFTGKGQAMVFHGGKLVRGTWSKSDLKAPIKLSTKAGDLTVPAGHTWIELVPAANGNATFTKR
jgi:hypothetical protein